jgi:hypothetical protein
VSGTELGHADLMISLARDEAALRSSMDGLWDLLDREIGHA